MTDPQKESYAEWSFRVTKEMSERKPRSWDEVREIVSARTWEPASSVREVLSRFAITDRCIYPAEFEDAEKFIAEEIIAALDAAGYVIVPKNAGSAIDRLKALPVSSRKKPLKHSSSR